MKILVTGGLGFIGSAVCRKLIKETDHQVVNIDKCSYASNLDSINEIRNSDRFSNIIYDLSNDYQILGILNSIKPDSIIHLAAETHVDNSIKDPNLFIKSNIIGTFNLLEWVRNNILTRFHYVSTDEVFGTLGDIFSSFNESSLINPRNPYSATKASAEHLVRSYTNTYRINSVITNCCNNYGPWQNKEKLIPKSIINCIKKLPIPIYGLGNAIRDWVYVDDHVDALLKIFFDTGADIGETYCIGPSKSNITNLDIVKKICKIMDQKIPSGEPHENLISFVPDRPGHDLIYKLNSNKINKELDWYPQETLETGLEKTVDWYLNEYSRN